MKKLGLYIHIPFCVRKCNYCDFYSLPHSTERETLYIDALCEHMRQDCHLYKSYEFDTVYLGGGTPSILSSQSIERIFATVNECFSLANEREITIELNPCSVTEEKLKTYKKVGINRLSIGMQSANDNELKCLGRLHTKEGLEKAYYLSRACGFENISLDLMFGLPDQSIKELLNTINFAISLSPEHISGYGLKIEENTPFGKNISTLSLPDDDEEYEMYMLLCKCLEEKEYEQYEISNFAKRGYHSRHNIKYWLSQEYIGLGASAHSFFNGVRYSYKNDIDKYIGCDFEKEKEDKENIYDVEKMDEYIMLRLRLSSGIDEDEFNFAFGKSFISEYPKFDEFIKSGHAKYKDGRYALTRDGFFVSNYIISSLIH